MIIFRPRTCPWLLSSSSDRRDLDIVDGTGPHQGLGAHYSRRTPGSKTFTGVGQEVVLVHDSGAAVWAVVRQKTPSKRGSGASRGRSGKTDSAARYVWRNMLFRRLPSCPDRASDLIKSATTSTYLLWEWKYGALPEEPLRTEVDAARVGSPNPGYCYKVAEWTAFKKVGSKIYLRAPEDRP